MTSTIPTSTPLYVFGLSVRAENALTQADIKTIEQLTTYTPEDLLMFKGLGATCLNEIVRKLAECGLSLQPTTRRKRFKQEPIARGQPINLD